MKYLIYRVIAWAIVTPILIGSTVVPLFNTAHNWAVYTAIGIGVLIVVEGLNVGTKLTLAIIEKLKEEVANG